MPLYIEESYTAILRRRLREGELDALIIALPFTEPDVVTQPLYDEPFVVLLPARHPLAEEQAIAPEQLEREIGRASCREEEIRGTRDDRRETNGREGRD